MASTLATCICIFEIANQAPVARAAGALFYSDEGGVMHKFMCDLCGKELEHHGERYMVRVEQVPAYRECHKCVWDLCPECADRLREQMDERGKRCATTS